MKRSKNRINIIKKFLKGYLSEIFLILGLSLIVYATYRLSPTASIYLSGMIFITGGLFISKYIRK